MATTRRIIDSAFRKIGITGVGRSATPGEYADALQMLQSLIRGLITSGAFGRMRDVYPTHDYTAGENERVYRIGNDTTQTIELPDSVPDYCVGTSDYGRNRVTYAGVRPPRDNAVITIVDQQSGNIEDYVYDGQRKLWFALHDMAPEYNEEVGDFKLMGALKDECPLSHRDANGLSAYLAVNTAPEYGSKIDEVIVMQSRQFLLGLTHNYSNRDYTR